MELKKKFYTEKAKSTLEKMPGDLFPSPQLW